METKIYFYLHNQVSKKTGKQKIYCKIKAGTYHPILIPLKQTRTSKTLACKEIDFISKNNNYLCTEIENASLINFTIIQYQERILKGITELNKINYPIDKELILNYVFEDVKVNTDQTNEPVYDIDDLPDTITGNINPDDIKKGLYNPDEVDPEHIKEDLDIFFDDSGKAQRKQDIRLGISEFLSDYFDRYIGENPDDSAKKSIINRFLKYSGDVTLKDFNQDLQSKFIEHLKTTGYTRKDEKREYSAKTIFTNSITITAFAYWLDAQEDINYKNVDVKQISIHSKYKKGKIVNYKIDNHSKTEMCLEFSEVKEIINYDASNELENIQKAKDMFHLQLLLGGARFKTLAKLKKENIREFNGVKTLVTDASKKRDNGIILLPEAIEIAKKWDYSFLKNLDTYNKNLRRLATKLNWNRTLFLVENRVNARSATTVKKVLCENFSSHYARHSCVSLLASKGFSVERIIDITRNSYKTVKFYLNFYSADRIELQKVFTKL